MPRPTASFEDVEAIQETQPGTPDAGGLLCMIEGKEVWIPKSQISDDSEVFKKGDAGTLVIPEWLAIEKKLV